MAKKKGFNVKAKIEQVLTQAKDSVKMLGDIEKKTVAKAKSFIKIPGSRERRRMTNDRILSGLRRLGVATQAEVDSLSSKIQELEASVHHPSHGASSKPSSANAEK
ncbi:MAG: phasin family protein [Bdellovibrionia bacterium]